MKITILIHPKSWFTHDLAVNLLPMLSKHTDERKISFQPRPVLKGDICFALHYPALLSPDELALHDYNFVIHGSALPKGRGRSPVHWQIEQGARRIPLTLFQVAPGMDEGPIYLTGSCNFEGWELLEDIRRIILAEEISMIDTLLGQWSALVPRRQTGDATYYEKRSAKNQRLNPYKSIADQWNKIRVADNDRYPLWLEMDNVKYRLKIERDGSKLSIFKRDLNPEPEFDF